MKFQQLPIGTRFEFEGKIYVKTGPISASSDQGGQRMIPRFANLTPLDGTVRPEPPRQEAKLDRADVMAAFDAFYADCEALVEGADAKTRLALARQRFEAALATDKPRD